MRFGKSLAVIAIAMWGAQQVFAENPPPPPSDSLTLIINEVTGAGQYQLTIGNGVTSVSSAWTALGVTSSTFDSMTTTNGGSSVGSTLDYLLQNISLTTGGSTYAIDDTSSVGWRGNISSYTGGTISNGVVTGGPYSNYYTEAALAITSGTPSSTASVSHLLVMDNTGTSTAGILVYNAPGAATGNVAAYGHTNGNYSSSTPITELGSISSGLEGDLENYSPFAGTGNGYNIATGQQTIVTDPVTNKAYYGYELNANPQANVYQNPMALTLGTDPAELFVYDNGSFSQYLSPTIIFEDAVAVPLPSTAATLPALLGIVGFAAYWRKSAKCRIVEA